MSVLCQVPCLTESWCGICSVYGDQSQAQPTEDMWSEKGSSSASPLLESSPICASVSICKTEVPFWWMVFPPQLPRVSAFSRTSMWPRINYGRGTLVCWYCRNLSVGLSFQHISSLFWESAYGNSFGQSSFFIPWSHGLEVDCEWPKLVRITTIIGSEMSISANLRQWGSGPGVLSTQVFG